MSKQRKTTTRLALLLVGLLATSAAHAQTAEGEASPRLPLRLAVQTEAAPGVTPGHFYNHMLGARLDVQFPPQISIGVYVGYVNLKGKGGRASNVLTYGQVEYMFSPFSGAVRVPIRFGSGYLPMNGPMARVSTGLAFWLSPRVDLITEVAPTFWVTGDQLLLSIDLALEVAYRF
jgi:hypothetical protein